jgi:zinc transport system substrate-binding protein
LKVVEASRGLPLLDLKNSQPSHPQAQSHGPEGKTDPHVWLDFSLDLKIVDAVAAAFAEKDPGGASEYRIKAEDYKDKLKALDEEFRSSLSTCRHRQIILGGHSAFSYLAKRYSLQQIPLYGISPNAEPTPKKLTEVIKAARSHGVKYIFFEELVNPKLAQVLAKEAGLQTLVLNDGANLTREQMEQKATFLGLMKKNLENLRRGLDCGPN